MARKRKFKDLVSEELIFSEELEASEPAPKCSKTPFAVWLDRKIKAGKIRPHQAKALRVFFAKQGLGESETVEDFNSAFAKF